MSVILFNSILLSNSATFGKQNKRYKANIIAQNLNIASHVGVKVSHEVMNDLA